VERLSAVGGLVAAKSTVAVDQELEAVEDYPPMEDVMEMGRRGDVAGLLAILRGG
jgi:hypothetical protein